ncbi:MAG: 3-dehydroquinate synthase, partial [Verrucomicrobia bacterium 21-51-4]
MVQSVFWGDCTEAIRHEIARLQAAGRRVALIASAGVLESHAEWAKSVFGDIPRMSIPSGESHKSLETLAQIYAFLASHELDRSSALIAWGGGVVGDIGGFAAASFLRGISYYQIPTTLLGMVDSAIGGKTGINLPQGKNLVGAVHLPQSVWVDPRFLKTLPAREFASGMAEVLKSALLGD